MMEQCRFLPVRLNLKTKFTECNIMSIVKVIEVLAESDKSWEDAAAVAVTKASNSVRDIKSIYIKEMEAKVENNKITQYRINAKISFVLE